jgi:hypothetical protein
MHLSPHSLQQIDDAYIESLDPEALRGLSLRLLADLKEAWDRLNQGPENSSRPPSSRAPWERKGGTQEAGAEADTLAVDGNGEATPAETPPAETPPAETPPAETPPAETPPARKPGKQPGAPGVGRTQIFQAQETQAHYPDRCAGCGQALEPAVAVAYTGFQAVDVRWGDPARLGLTWWVVDHRYYSHPR